MKKSIADISFNIAASNCYNDLVDHIGGIQIDASLSLILLKKILVLFIIVLMGFITVKGGRLKSSDSSVLSRLCFDWIIPCSLLSSFQVDYEAEKAQAFLFACIIAIFSTLLFIAITRLSEATHV